MSYTYTHIFFLLNYVMVFNATFINISVKSWQSVLLVEETGVPGENHRPAGNHWQILLHNVVHTMRAYYIYVPLNFVSRKCSCYNFHLILWVESVLVTTLYDTFLVAGQWFSSGTQDSSTNKTSHHHVTEILLQAALNIHSQPPKF
jgi:hypothetical protein